MEENEKTPVEEIKEVKVEEPTNKEVDKLKQALSKSNAEAAEYKRKLREKMSEQEQRDAEAKEAAENMKAELDALRRERTVANYKAEYLKIGYDADLAAATAEALANGETEKVFANQKVVFDNLKKQYEANALNNTPDLTAGKPVSEQEIYKEKLRHWAGLK